MPSTAVGDCIDVDVRAAPRLVRDTRHAISAASAERSESRGRRRDIVLKLVIGRAPWPAAISVPTWHSPIASLAKRAFDRRWYASCLGSSALLPRSSIINTESSNDLASISIDTLDHITGGNGPGDKVPEKKDRSGDPGQGGGRVGKSLADAVRGSRGESPASTGATVHNGGGNSDYYY